MDAQLIDALRPLTTSFEEMGVAYEISGSIASSLHGVPRSSIDADILAALEAAHVPKLARKLQERYYLSEMRMADAVSRGASFNLIHLDSMLKLDVFIAKSDRFRGSRWRGGRATAQGGLPFPVFRRDAEDIVHKLSGFEKEEVSTVGRTSRRSQGEQGVRLVSDRWAWSSSGSRSA
jgi:hypothetical protein